MDPGLGPYWASPPSPEWRVASKTLVSHADELPWDRPRGDPKHLTLISDQVGLPPELKHINKARNRNQQGFPQ